VIGSTVTPCWVFPGWHFAHSDRNGPVGLVNVVNGSVGTVTGRHHTGQLGGPTVITSHNGRYLVIFSYFSATVVAKSVSVEFLYVVSRSTESLCNAEQDALRAIACFS